jgi:hypothetical protein
MKPNVVFTCECVTCGNVEDKQPDQVDPELGPTCTKCLGPMITTKVAIERPTQRHQGKRK